jgi:thymidylate synthase (FAD)
MSVKIIRDPKVRLIGRQIIVESELQRFLDEEGTSWATDTEIGAERLVEFGGRICYDSYAKPRPGGNKAYIDHILDSGHGSVCEHSVWNIAITGISRSLSHELIRHRAGFAYSQRSQRYVDESVSEYVVPPDLQEEHAAAVEFIARCQTDPKLAYYKEDTFTNQHKESLKLACGGMTNLFKSEEEQECIVAGLSWIGSMLRASEDYRFQSDYLARKAARRGLEKTEARKFARQAARSVLPNATETKIFVTANARALRHFLEQRGSQHAEPEIRKLANAMLEVLAKDSPNLFSDYVKTPLPDGTYEITTKFPKV